MKRVYNSAYPLGSISARKESELLWPSVLLGIFIVTPALLPALLETFLFLLFLFFPVTVWLFARDKLPDAIPRFVGPLLLIALIGLLNFPGHKAYEIAKDIWYILNPALALIAGFVLMLNLKDLRRLFRVFVIAAALIALFHLFQIAMHYETLSKDAMGIRYEAGPGYIAPVLAVAIFLTARKMNMPIFGKHVWISYFTLVLCLSSLVLSFSRTLGVAAILICLSVFGWINFQSRIKVMLMALSAVALIGTGLALPRSLQNVSHPSFSDKLLNSLQEMKVKEYHSMRDINNNWRGFETAKALDTYAKGTMLEYLVGQGLGSKIDLGLYIPLGNKNFRFIPTLHNGYVYLIVKTGILGLFLYLLLLYRMARTGTVLDRSGRIEIKYCGRLIVGLSLAFASSTFVIAGMLNKSVTLPMTILLGALLGYVALDREGESEPKKMGHEVNVQTGY